MPAAEQARAYSIAAGALAAALAVAQEVERAKLTADEFAARAAADATALDFVVNVQAFSARREYGTRAYGYTSLLIGPPLIWHPEIGPMTYTIVNNASPNAREIPRTPISSPASTALPTPPNTSTNVPTSSAMSVSRVLFAASRGVTRTTARISLPAASLVVHRGDR